VSEPAGRVCPVELAGSLDNRFRRWVQNPQKILEKYVQEGMTVLDIGCGPGFFSLALAQMVGPSGRVIAADLQEGMLQNLEGKIRGTALEGRIALHRCEAGKIGVSEPVDLVLAFYVVHEIPDKGGLFIEVASILKPDGSVFIAEPPFHVSRADFEETLGKAQGAGFAIAERPKLFLSKAVVLKKC
jgi:ubiquinone/menaquinone biosynthesis C-methylase UbiE